MDDFYDYCVNDFYDYPVNDFDYGQVDDYVYVGSTDYESYEYCLSARDNDYDYFSN